MQYLATYYWQSAKRNASSLMLQQVYHKKRKLPMLLACICADTPNNLEGGRLVTSLSDWFYETGLYICSRKGEKGMPEAGRNVEMCLRRERENSHSLQIAGVLCMGSSLRIFQQGGMGIRLLNMRNNRPYSSELRMDGGVESCLLFQDGYMQPGAGILVATDSFYDHVPAKILEECLDTRELRTQSRMERRLQELGSLGEERGGTDMGAILIITK